jgi:cyclomaltodextrinase / maltogenic alpha-amylase / neopullulanase
MEKLTLTFLSILLIIAISFTGCKLFSKKKEEIKPLVTEVVHPDWSKNIVMYEVNLRQYTPEGTLKAFETHLPGLKSLGVDVLWFMPTFPIGVVNRKGELGSYYSVKDFMDVNPEFGTLDDFKEVLGKAHELGFRVMLDWVPNHTSWDNPLAAANPDFYVKDSTGKFTPPIGTDWTDVIQLDWTKQGLQDYMVEALKFWVNMGVDGFRVDHPHNTPVAFWERARKELDAIKPVLMLAEIEEPYNFLEKGFDMNYAWEHHHLMNSIAQGKDSVSAMNKYFEREWKKYPNNAYRLQFLTNHDENSWAGTIDSLMGDAQKMYATMIFTDQAVPLIYSGQEDCLAKKLKFFVRDPIVWDSCSMTAFYQSLIKLKKDNEALWNGDFGGKMVKITTNKDNKIFAYSREKNGNRVLVFLNLTKKPVSFMPSLNGLEGDYTEYFSGEKVSMPSGVGLTLNPWGFKVFIK